MQALSVWLLMMANYVWKFNYTGAFLRSRLSFKECMSDSVTYI